MRLLAPTFCALVIAAGTAAAQPTAVDPPPTITVSAAGEASAAPDVATIEIGITARERSARDALAAANRTVGETAALLRGAGVEGRDMQTAAFTVQPAYDNGRLVGTDVSNTLTVRVRDLSKLGPILDQATSLGANRIVGPRFTVTDAAPLRDEARRRAVAEAARRARLLAEAAGVRLGRVLSIQENGAGPEPAPYLAARAAAPQAAVPIEAGETTYRAGVTLSWEILQ